MSPTETDTQPQDQGHSDQQGLPHADVAATEAISTRASSGQEGQSGSQHQEPAGDQGYEQTAPLWFGEPTRLPNPATADPSGAPSWGGGHPAYPQPPAPTTETDPGKPRNRRFVELVSVAALAALLASGGTYAATQLSSGSESSSTASSSSLDRGATTPGPVKQADPNNPNWSTTAAAVAPSVVAITMQSQSSAGQGSGVIIDKAGHVLTNNHVVNGATQLTVTLNDGRTYDATVVGTDPSTDLAVISISKPPSDLAPIAFGDSEALNVGDPVMAVGNPLGLAGTVTTGIVSALNRPVTTSESEQSPGGQSQSEPVVTNAIQTSAAINPGNSGGALVNASGQLVGINSSIASLGSGSGGQSGSIGIGFAIPVNEAKSIAQQLIDKGRAQHAFLGVSLKDGTASDGSAQRAGAEIVTIQPGTPAAEAGLKTGDLVVAVDDQPANSSESLVAYIRERTVGDKVTLTVLRDGKTLTLTASLAVRPSS
jgi:putative serine protease PepD